ncbi:MAG TPA: ROK family protein [Ktedonobacterales bacterium]|nr:ROK family protein [Ktedonobacterales bacterium]
MAHSTQSSNAPPAMGSIGIEIADGGMRMVAAYSDDTVISRRRWRRQLSAPPTADEALTALNELIGQILDERGQGIQEPSGMGVAIWGEVDFARQVTRDMPHATGWGNFPLAERLSGRWRREVRLASAVEAAGLAEAQTGAGKHRRTVLYLHSGRTIASALIVSGAVVPGATGRAGKLGHWLVQPDGPRCACGMRGHLDPIASAQSIVRATIGLASGSDESTAAMLRVSHGRAEAMTVRQVLQLASEGDSSAQTVLERAWDALALALANLVAALDPDAIVIGGPPADAGEAFCAPLRERLATLCGAWRPIPAVLLGALEPWAALSGACLLPAIHEKEQPGEWR